MKGLLLHNFYCARRTIGTLLGYLILGSLFFLLLLVGIKYGNLRDLDYDGYIVTTLFLLYVVLMPFFAGICTYILVSEIFSAEKKGWGRYMFSLPVEDNVRLGADYIAGTIVSLSAFIITFAVSAVFLVIIGDLTSEFLLVLLAVYCAALTLSYIMITAIYILKSQFKATFFWLALYAVGGILITLGVRLPGEGTGERIGSFLSMINYSAALPVILVAFAAASYFISLRSLKGREKIC